MQFQPCPRYLLAATVLGLASITQLSSVTTAADPLANRELAAKVQSMYEDYRDHFKGVAEVTPDSLKAWLMRPGTIVVDVRPSEERDVSIIAGAISAAQFESNAEDYGGFRVVTYCTIGYRSGEYAQKMTAKGIEAYNLAGGILGWIHAGAVVEHEGADSREVHVYGRRWSLLPEGYEARW